MTGALLLLTASAIDGTIRAYVLGAGSVVLGPPPFSLLNLGASQQAKRLDHVHFGLICIFSSYFTDGI